MKTFWKWVATVMFCVALVDLAYPLSMWIQNPHWTYMEFFIRYGVFYVLAVLLDAKALEILHDDRA